ncbi:glyoxylase-like metal-dependent hydrolase (beta-lactamase superfamily II) [Haloactinopolyspora alba]|uniref:Glyoxylase-like metal-dependent hydrolase (Beta-lactamase superfamily II) n=1 Tax=Haloactinopolyspora alba TaxID=648780 RepID=A0A2P8E7L1_9ACTN|nr:MBL fold metallo-hydrolase [Haloactinopolyspora alba]PSL05455.1 glyoxylase-like metal-dependent hydrolase (beta-lactamase superfamily II) [Haloactinopolyspora alba]
MARLVEVTGSVLVGTSDFCSTTTTVVLGADDTCLVVDPAVTPDDLDALVAELAERGLRVVAGFSTHPHWDHVLWSRALGTGPRFATAAAVRAMAAERRRALGLAERSAPGHDPDLFGRLTPLPDGAATVPWDGPVAEVIEHRAHAPGHAALYLRSEGILLAGDMCSDVEIPLLDLDVADPVGDYRHALGLFAALNGVEYVVPGHGSVGDGAEFRRRVAADRHYLDELEAGRGSDDARLTDDWLVRDHRAHLRHVSGSPEPPEPAS